MKEIGNNYWFKKCPLCNSSRIHKLGNLKYTKNLKFSTNEIFLKRTPEIWKCKNCCSGFTQNCISPEIAEKLYASGEGTQRWSYESFEDDKTEILINFFNNLLQKGDKILDIGCNTGEFLDFARKIGYKTYGLEICYDSFCIINQKHHGGFNSYKDVNEKFGIITAFDLIEHLYKIDEFLEFAHQKLNENGLLIILTGNINSFQAQISKAKWWYINYPEHVIFPSIDFFKNLEKFMVVNVYKTYASITHENLHREAKILNILVRIIKNNYDGIPAIFEDHQFVILKKRSLDK
ncbi:MAG: class I SAM-dependent methyltransferase [Cytophagales bacterium]|nr:class I SAM-dependent methyltransferase [Cytophagales bacterium]